MKLGQTRTIATSNDVPLDPKLVKLERNVVQGHDTVERKTCAIEAFFNKHIPPATRTPKVQQQISLFVADVMDAQKSSSHVLELKFDDGNCTMRLYKCNATVVGGKVQLELQGAVVTATLPPLRLRIVHHTKKKKWNGRIKRSTWVEHRQRGVTAGEIDKVTGLMASQLALSAA